LPAIGGGHERHHARPPPLGFKQIAAGGSQGDGHQHDMRDIGELPAFPGAAM